MANDKVYFNSGALFKTTDKKSEKEPDYRATIQLDEDTLDAIIASSGKIKIAGWLRDSAKGKFVSLLVSADNYVKPETKPVQNNAPQDAKSSRFENIDEDIPF